jgi:hypothetical protein
MNLHLAGSWQRSRQVAPARQRTSSQFPSLEQEMSQLPPRQSARQLLARPQSMVQLPRQSSSQLLALLHCTLHVLPAAHEGEQLEDEAQSSVQLALEQAGSQSDSAHTLGIGMAWQAPFRQRPPGHATPSPAGLGAQAGTDGGWLGGGSDTGGSDTGGSDTGGSDTGGSDTGAAAASVVAGDGAGEEASSGAGVDGLPASAPLEGGAKLPSSGVTSSFKTQKLA